MDESLRHINPNPTLTANFISRGLFWWCNPLLKKGYHKPLQESDLYNVCPSDASDYLGNLLEREWIKQLGRQKQGENPSLLRALFNVFGIQYILIGFVVLFEESTRIVQPILLGGLIRFFTPSSAVSKFEAWMYALGVSLCAIILAVSHHPYFFSVQRIGMRMRVACCSLIYKKCLRLSNKAMGETTTGQIVNLMSNDVNRFDQAVIFLHYLWVGPLQAIVVLVILWNELGPSVLAGFIVLVLLIPVQGFMGKLFSKLRLKTALHTDERVKVMNEIISGMRVIKMYCWEKPFKEIIEKIRSRELRAIWRSKLLTAYTCSVWLFVHRLMYYTLAVGIVIGQSWASLRPATLYKATPLLFLVAYNLVGCVFEAVRSQGEWHAACSRIQKFLLLDELKQSVTIETPKAFNVEEKGFLQLENVTAKWNGSIKETNTLDGINLKVLPGQLIAIIGPVGSGKSSLLMAILGELPVQKGGIKATGRLAYVSQQPWIFSGSVRQNIVFGSKFDKAKYDRVIQVSALRKDFEIMPQGDATLIGDRGVSLSGGQKARVSLARALYMDADVYLLDDPLSAVDSAVGRHIFEKCIIKHLKHKPRILVTHQIQFLPIADTIYIMKDGRIHGHGTFDDLSHSGVDFLELLKRPEVVKPAVSIPENINVPIDGLLPNCEALGSTVSINTIVDDYEPETVQLPDIEERASGSVGYKVYVEYFRGGTGLIKFILLVIINIIAQMFYVGSDWWLSRWSNQEEERHAAIEKQNLLLTKLNSTDFNNQSIISSISNIFNNSINSIIISSSNNTSNITIPLVDSYFNIYVFTGIILAMFLFALARALLFFKIAVDASQKLHNQMFARLLRAPISFFDTNPVGRILNRFSKDVGHMDDLLPVTFFDFIQCLFLIIGIVLVAEVVNPFVVIPTVPLVILFVLVRKYYLQTSRSIKRLESTSRSPVFSYLSATIQGLQTIRSMKMEDKCMEEFDAYQDKHSEAWFLFLATSRWLAIRLDWLCALFVTAVTVCSVLASDDMNAGLVGLSVTYTMTLMGMFQWGVRQSAEVENQMVSVERVLEYSSLLQEAEVESKPEHKPPPSWPHTGAITGTDISLQYFPGGPFVLKNLNFVIHGKEKIGIVGRTGAGKSSFITSLFRLVEPQGSLIIDNINIQKIGLHDLRSNISIIPQDPVLFTGSLRQNLDPFHKHTDLQLWRAFEEVKLKDQIKDIPEGLSVKVSEGGMNYSVGQRQLICLARAILGNTKVLLIDEATANVDPVTDELIQQTIRSKFKDCTVLTIAHRLHTVMDSDRIMVLDMGEIVEFGKPFTLLSSGHGFFYNMVQQTGKVEFNHLLEVARNSALKSDPSSVVTNGIIKSAILLITQDHRTEDNSSRLHESDRAESIYGSDDIEELSQFFDNLWKEEISGEENNKVDEWEPLTDVSIEASVSVSLFNQPSKSGSLLAQQVKSGSSLVQPETFVSGSLLDQPSKSVSLLVQPVKHESSLVEPGTSISGSLYTQPETSVSGFPLDQPNKSGSLYDQPGQSFSESQYQQSNFLQQQSSSQSENIVDDELSSEQESLLTGQEKSTYNHKQSNHIKIPNRDNESLNDDNHDDANNRDIFDEKQLLTKTRNSQDSLDDSKKITFDDTFDV